MSQNIKTEGPTRLFVRRIFETKFEDLPAKVVDQAKNCVLDFLGVAMGGLSTEVGQVVRQYAKLFVTSDEATVLATGRKANSLDAAFANGVVAHVLELDDGNRFAMGHPGVVTIPAALAMAEKMHANGSQLILSIVCGYETFGKLGRAINPSHFSRGFHTTGTLGTMAATVAASKILSLNEDQMLSAFGIAGSLAAGISEFLSDGSMTKQINAGRAALNGVFAAELALRGFTGPATVLEGEHGFFKALSDKTNPEEVTRSLGSNYEITNTYFKRHASCRHSHPAVDATLEILAREKFDPRTIDGLTVKTYSAAYDYTNRKNVSTPLSAKMSMPYCIAITMLHGKAGPDEFTEKAIKNEEVRGVKMSVDDELDKLVPEKRGAIVTINVGGKEFSSRVDLPKGEPENPLTRAEFEGKFATLASTSLSEKDIRATLTNIRELEHMSDVRKVTGLLSSQLNAAMITGRPT